ncbi:MAG: ribbon-helix-helix protein, CopG family [Euzebyales bacterium]|nr:ribbon-helix-helix protein, CopG family [Euzebyales bacterium]
MCKTTSYLDAADDALLRQAAACRGSTRSALIREAFRHLLQAETAADRRPRPARAQRPQRHAERVDELLEDGFGQ